ncbi:MAG: ATP-binding protein [Erysipelotrichaceae bacterium]
MLINRTILPIVKQSTEEYPVTLITGARQVGKTTLASYFEREKGYKYISFDDTDLLNEAKNNPKLFLEKQGYPLIIDEVQKETSMFTEIERIVNEKRRKEGSQAANGMYILTGSQKFSLMKEVSESMSGRVGIIEMSPLSQSEINGWEESPFSVNNEILMKKCESNYLSEDDLYTSIVRGFYPARWEIENKPIANYYSNYVKTYIDRDVSQLINLKDKVKFENMLKVLASLTGEELIIDNIAKTIGVDNKTVNQWISIAITGDIISLLPPYYENSINKRIVKRNKLYFNDTGLACYLLGIDTPKSLKLSTFKGRVVETYMHNEIVKSYLNNGLTPNVFFYRDGNQNEIDLIILRDGNLNLIECKSGKNFSSSDIKGFLQLSDTKYEIEGQCVICTTKEAYRIAPATYAYPVQCI